MSNLRIDYERLNGLVNDMRICEIDIENIYSDMRLTVSSLIHNGYMEAEAATAYVNEFNSLLAPDIESLKTLISDYYTQLNNICNAFAEADNKMSQMLI